MIEDLGPEARALLDAARQGMSPDAAAVRRVRAKIDLAASGTAAGTAVGVKLGIVAVVAAVAIGGGLYARRGPTASSAPRVELASPSEAPVQAAVHEPAAPVSSPASLPASLDDELITIETPLVETARRAVATTLVESETPRRGGAGRSPAVGLPAGASPAGASPAGASPSGAAPGEQSVVGKGGGSGVAGGAGGRARGIDLAREVELLDAAMAALRRGDASGALQAVQRHAAETAGRGQLAEDAAAIEIEALCHLHDPTTNAKLEAFDARFPRSAQRSRLENKCP